MRGVDATIAKRTGRGDGLMEDGSRSTRDEYEREIIRLKEINADLLAACEDALEDGEVYRLSEAVKAGLRAAIAKARGA